MYKAALILTLTLASPVLAEQIVLIDGSTIMGEVLSMQNGSYQIKTQSLGVVNLPRSQVKSISSGADLPGAAADNNQGALQSLQANMANDPGIMSSIMNLQNHPDMQAVLNDPEVMRAIQSFDLQTLANHPKIKKLMNNSEVRSIQHKVN